MNFDLNESQKKDSSLISVWIDKFADSSPIDVKNFEDDKQDFIEFPKGNKYKDNERIPNFIKIIDEQ